MNKYFEEISGYQDIKEKLEIILEMLNKKTEYIEKGVGVDNAVLILGESGTGKTVIANCFISATGRSAYVCKKSISGAEAVDGIVATFDDAMKNEPSIVLIEGLDDYSRDNSDEMTEKFAVIQSFLDVPLFSIQLSFFIAMITMIINRIERA